MIRSYARLEVIIGPMFAGKTSELVKRILWQGYKNRQLIVFKPAFDSRFADSEIVTHTHIRQPALSVPSAAELLKWARAEKPDHIFIDEIQFFDDGLLDVVRQLLAEGIDVTAGGLDMDFEGRPFLNSAMLMAAADEVVKLKAYCTLCGRDAAKSFKKSGSRDRVELGAADKYEPRCNEHWHALAVEPMRAVG